MQLDDYAIVGVFESAGVCVVVNSSYYCAFLCAGVCSNRRYAGEAVTSCAAVFTPLLFDLDALEASLPPRPQPADAAAATTAELAAVLGVMLDDADPVVDAGRAAQGAGVWLRGGRERVEMRVRVFVCVCVY